MILYPYKPGSESAKVLAEAVGIKRISHKNSKFKPAPNKVILNWGASKMPQELMQCVIINHPDAVSVAANKLTFFQKVSPADLGHCAIKHTKSGKVHRLPADHAYAKGLKPGDVCVMDNDYTVLWNYPFEDFPRVPAYTTSRETAEVWVRHEDAVVVARTVLNGNSGEGIVIIKDMDDFVDAPLYVRYVQKKQEYRVHILNDQVVDVQRKARRKDVPDDQVNWLVRNHDNGFIFARDEALGDIPEDVTRQALLAVKVCGLDFGAVDVIFNEKFGRAYVLEVNTAPGLSGATLEGYAARLKEMMA